MSGANEIAIFRDQLQKQLPQFQILLPGSLAERFIRVAMTAVQKNKELLECNRVSLMQACMECAQDGLEPDNKQAALVIFKTKQKDGSWAKIATYLPMILGYRMKLRQYMDVADMWCEVVYEGEHFVYKKGDHPSIDHEPSLQGSVGRKPLCAYSIIKFRDGNLSREVMPWADIIAVRDRYARAKTTKSGPWYDPVSIGEMAKKTVFRRHIKQMHCPPELLRLISRDDELYDLKPQLGEDTPIAAIEAREQRRLSLSERLDQLVAPSAAKTESGEDYIVANDPNQDMADDLNQEADPSVIDQQEEDAERSEDDAPFNR